MREEYNSSSSSRRNKSRSQSSKRNARLPLEEATPLRTFDRSPHQHAHARKKQSRILSVMGLILSIEIIAALLTSPVFGIRKIQISGLSRLSNIENFKTQQAIRVEPGTNWILSPNARIRRSLSDLPWIQSTSVSRSLPTNIAIKIQLRKPLLVVQSGIDLFEVDSQGAVIRTARPEIIERLPRVELAGWSTPIIGKHLHSIALKTILDRLILDRKDISARIAKIEVDQSDNICLNMKDGIRIIFGSSEEWKEKMALTIRLYNSEPNAASRFASINLSVPSSPVCILRDTKQVSIDPSVSQASKL